MRITDRDGSTVDVRIVRIAVSGNWWQEGVTDPEESLQYECADESGAAYKFGDDAPYAVELLSCTGRVVDRRTIGDPFDLEDPKLFCRCTHPDPERVLVWSLALELRGNAVITSENVVHDDARCMCDPWTFESRFPVIHYRSPGHHPSPED